MLSGYYGGREADEIVSWMAAVAKGEDPIISEIKQRPGLYKEKTDMVRFGGNTGGLSCEWGLGLTNSKRSHRNHSSVITNHHIHPPISGALPFVLSIMFIHPL
jgi:hypothetical protein